jgi:hypothetical protein
LHTTVWWFGLLPRICPENAMGVRAGSVFAILLHEWELSRQDKIVRMGQVLIDGQDLSCRNYVVKVAGKTNDIYLLVCNILF